MKNTFFTIFESIQKTINGLITVIIALAVVGFLWGIVKILFNPENEVAKKEGRSFMLYGIFTLFVMTSVWGLVNLLASSITPVPKKNMNNQQNAYEYIIKQNYL